MTPTRAARLVALVWCATGVACGLELAGTLDVSGGADAGAGIDGTVGGSPDASADAAAHDGAADDSSTLDGAADASPPHDAADEPDAAPPPCNGLRCGAGCLVDASTCTQCDAGTLLCAASASCGPDCTSCPSRPIQCYACDGDRQNPVGSCQPNDSTAYCLSGDYGGNNLHCACNTAADCPSPFEVCIPHDPGDIFNEGNACYTCGEIDSTHDTTGDTCRSGGACVVDADIPTCE